MFWTDFRNIAHELRDTLYTRSQPVLFLCSKVHSLGTNKDDSNNIWKTLKQQPNTCPGVIGAGIHNKHVWNVEVDKLYKTNNRGEVCGGGDIRWSSNIGVWQVSLPWHKALSLAHSWTGPSRLFILCPAINRIHPRHHGAIISQSNLRPAGW